MANTLKLEIVTPDAKVFSDDVDMVTLPGVEGAQTGAQGSDPGDALRCFLGERQAPIGQDVPELAD